MTSSIPEGSKPTPPHQSTDESQNPLTVHGSIKQGRNVERAGMVPAETSDQISSKKRKRDEDEGKDVSKRSRAQDVLQDARQSKSSSQIIVKTLAETSRKPSPNTPTFAGYIAGKGREVPERVADQYVDYEALEGVLIAMNTLMTVLQEPLDELGEAIGIKSTDLPPHVYEQLSGGGETRNLIHDDDIDVDPDNNKEPTSTPLSFSTNESYFLSGGTLASAMANLVYQEIAASKYDLSTQVLYSLNQKMALLQNAQQAEKLGLDAAQKTWTSALADAAGSLIGSGISWGYAGQAVSIDPDPKVNPNYQALTSLSHTKGQFFQTLGSSGGKVGASVLQSQKEKLQVYQQRLNTAMKAVEEAVQSAMQKMGEDNDLIRTVLQSLLQMIKNMGPNLR